MTPVAEVLRPETKLRARVRAYQGRIAEIERYLKARPQEWGRFQSEFNQEINSVFRDLMMFEKQSLGRGDEEKVYKLKRLFINRFRKVFTRGEYIVWSLEKPMGYAGDHKIIDDIYRNAPPTAGFDRLFDNYFMMSGISNAVRNRKEDFKKIVLDVARRKTGKGRIKIMNLASGPCREVHELLADPALKGRDVVFHCFDHDARALEYARSVIGRESRVEFFKQNAVRIALKGDVEKAFEGHYDLIYSMGLFDYLDLRISVRLVHNLRRLLAAGGVLAISDVRDKFSNPSVHFMEWVGDWNLTYRSDEEFRGIFLEAGFARADLQVNFEQQGVMQYVIGTKRPLAGSKPAAA